MAQKVSSYALYKQRRERLLEMIRVRYTVDHGVVLLFAGFENGRTVFRQESSFFYLTGVTEPGAVLWLDLDGNDKLYLPQFDQQREQWVACLCKPGQEKQYEVKEIGYLGDAVKGYTLNGTFKHEQYKKFIADLQVKVGKGQRLFTLCDQSNQNIFQQRGLFAALQRAIPVADEAVTDISQVVYSMRRTKDQLEIALIHNAVQITHMAHETVAGMIEAGKKEHEVLASAEYVFMHVAGVQPAFPSIVATGKNATILHYTGRMHELRNNELVVVDIGAEYNGYAADISRTYPVSGMFTKRQRELYDVVLETQLYVESIAAIGMYLRNDQYPEQSLHHLAVAFLRKKKYEKYFCHGIGHFLGLEVHDVGDHNVPLKEGDVITIEPGLYIPEENIGIRIEDDYVIVQDGAACLSYELPKQADEVELLMNKLR